MGGGGGTGTYKGGKKTFKKRPRFKILSHA